MDRVIRPFIWIFNMLKQISTGLRDAFDPQNRRHTLAGMGVMLMVVALMALSVSFSVQRLAEPHNAYTDSQHSTSNYTEKRRELSTRALFNTRRGQSYNMTEPMTIVYAVPAGSHCVMTYPDAPWLETDYVVYSPRGYDTYFTLQRPAYGYWQHEQFVPRTDYLFAGSHLIVMQRVPNLQLMKISSDT
jgi:hypothetical protein